MKQIGVVLAFQISIHGLRVEPDIIDKFNSLSPETFQSTGSARSPTSGSLSAAQAAQFQSTGSARSPTGFTDEEREELWISIHGLREEPDGSNTTSENELSSFQSTGSARSPTRVCAPRNGDRRNFNPRAPRGARLFFLPSLHHREVFQSTGSARSPTFPP